MRSNSMTAAGCSSSRGLATCFRPEMDLREILPRDGRNAVQQADARSALGRELAVAAAHELSQTHHRDGEWLVLRRRIHAPGLCDIAIAADEATFGLSEVNWGIIPGGVVTRAVVGSMNVRNAMYHILTGIPFDGKKAAEMGLVNEAVPKSQLRARTVELAKLLLGKNPNTLRACKQAVRAVQGMPYELSADYLAAKSAQLEFYDDEKGRNDGLTQFLDEKSYRPGLGAMRRKKQLGLKAVGGCDRPPSDRHFAFDAATLDRDRRYLARAEFGGISGVAESRRLWLSAAAVHLVSRNQTNIGNRACVRAIDDLPERLDAAMLFIPRIAIEDAVAACARRGVGGVVVFAAGFARGRRAMAGAAGAHRRYRACGRVGVVWPELPRHRRFRARHSAHLRAPDRATRAGFVRCGRHRAKRRTCEHCAGGAHGQRLAVICTVSTGNEAVLGLEDYAAYLLEDPATKVVVAFAEQIRKPQRFLAMAARARELGKPVSLLLSGHSVAARESAKSHTGALAGDYAVIEALLRHDCVLLVQSLEELFDVAELALRFPAPPSKGLAIVTDFGAIKGLALDYCETLGLDLPPLSPGPRGDHSGRVAGFRRCLQPARPDCAGDHPSGNV